MGRGGGGDGFNLGGGGGGLRLGEGGGGLNLGGGFAFGGGGLFCGGRGGGGLLGGRGGDGGSYTGLGNLLGLAITSIKVNVLPLRAESSGFFLLPCATIR